MSMGFEIHPRELRKALADIEKAEAKGFMGCRAVFYIAQAGQCIWECQAKYSDIHEAGREGDSSVDWGRYQGVTNSHHFIDGKLVPNEEATTSKTSSSKRKKKVV